MVLSLYEVPNGIDMNYDIREIYSEAQERFDWRTGHEKLEWLISEVARLQEENERLLEENRMLREEVTLARLGFQSGTVPEAPLEEADNLPAEARAFYQTLPGSFVFSEYFRMAEEYGLLGPVAKDYLKLFLREKLLLQTGTRIEKVRPSPSTPSPARNPRW